MLRHALAASLGLLVPAVSGADDLRARLLDLAGSYATENEYSPAPGAPAFGSRGVSTLSPALGGKFLREESSSAPGESRPQEALKLWGFDEATGRYQAAWAYSGSTAILLLEGEPLPDGEGLSLEGSYLEPATGRHTLRVELRRLDAASFRLVLKSFGEDGAERATLRTTYTRIDPGATGPR